MYARIDLEGCDEWWVGDRPTQEEHGILQASDQFSLHADAEA